MKSSPLLGPFGDSEFWGFSLLKIKIGWVLWCFKLQTIVSCALIHSTLLSSWLLSEAPNHSTQPILIFPRVRVLHLDRLKEGTWLYSFELVRCGSICGSRTKTITLSTVSVKNLIYFNLKQKTAFKVHIFWEGHKILRNLPLTFDCMYCCQK